MLKIAVVEDNKKEADELKSHIERTLREACETFEIRHYIDAVKFLNDYTCDFDIVFMDIEMPQLSGMDAAKKLRKLDADVLLIFVTNMVQFAVGGYEVSAYDFIVKPVSYFNFAIKFKRALIKLKVMKESEDELPLPFKGGMKRLPISSIKYIEVRGHHLFFHTFSETFDVCGNLTKIEERLKKYCFSRCNSCYLVNLKYVTEVKSDSAIVSGDELQISRRRRQNFIDDLTVYMGDA